MQNVIAILTVRNSIWIESAMDTLPFGKQNRIF